MPQYLITLFLGLSILLSLILARGATILRSPLIVGYIVAGAILGPDVLGLVTEQQVMSMDIVNLVVLSLIGFGIGGELRFKEIQTLGKSIIFVVIFEALGAFILVGLASALILKSISLGLLYGALASATAPAGTVEVIKQYKTKGEFTTTLYAVVGLDDMIALLLFTISLPIAIILLGGGGNVSILDALEHAGIEIILSIGFGLVASIMLLFIAKQIYEKTELLLFAFGVILMNCGLSEYLNLSPILLNMTMGIIVVNKNPLISNKIFNALGDLTPPMYVWFFVLIGTRLDAALIHKYAFLIIVYIIVRSLGKWSGTFLGAQISGASHKIRNYLGLALMSQAGVAVGLALAAAKALERTGLHIQAVQLISTITATTFIVMLLGPIMAKIALFKSGEMNVSK